MKIKNPSFWRRLLGRLRPVGGSPLVAEKGKNPDTKGQRTNERLSALQKELKALTQRVSDLEQQAALRPPEPVIAAPAPAAAPPKPAAKKPAPARKGLSLVIMGAGGHGQKHIDAFTKLDDCHISYVCDADSRIGKEAVEKIFALKGYRPKFVHDFRETLRDPAVDCIAIATPHHWHALATIWSLQAGKHVYVEKPITHTFSEGPSVLAAAQKYKKIVQAGTQLRSNLSLEAAGAYMRSGQLGQIDLVHCLIHKDRPPVPLSNENKMPATVDFDLYCGPAEMSEVRRSKFHYHWHWLWDLGNGALGNNGIHRIDAARIALDLKGYGDLVLSLGGRFGPLDSGETPNNQLTLYKFGSVWVLQDVLGLAPKPFKGIENGLIFYGTKGTIVYKSGYATLYDLEDREVKRFEGKQLNHYQNFLDAVRTKDLALARGNLSEGIISSDLCHFGNISYRLGAPASDEDITEKIRSLGAPDFVIERLTALRQNLTDNDVADPITLGEVLYLQDGPEPIRGNPAAEEYLSRSYRAPYIVPAPHEV